MRLLNKKSGCKITLILSACAFMLLCSTNSYSQAADAWVDFTGPQMPANNYAGTYYVLLPDTNNVSQIEVSLGTATGLTDIMSHTYDYDVSSGLPSGYSYARSAAKLTLGIGNYNEHNTYFGTVRIKNNSGTWSSSFNFITN